MKLRLPKTHTLLTLSALAAFCLPILPLVQATDFSWDLAGNGDWSDANNWDPTGGPPDGAGDGAFFNTGSNTSNPLREVTLDGDFQLGELRVAYIDGLSAWGNVKLLASGPSSSLTLDNGTDTAKLFVASSNANLSSRGFITLGENTSLSLVGGGAYVASVDPDIASGVNQATFNGELRAESGAALNIGTASSPSQFIIGAAMQRSSTQQTINGLVVAESGSAVSIHATDLIVGSNATNRGINSGDEPRGRFGTLDLADATVSAFTVEDSFIIGRNTRHYLFDLATTTGPGSHGIVRLTDVNGSVGGDLWVGDFYEGEDTQTSSSGLLTLGNATLTIAGDVDIWETGVVEVTLNGAPSGLILSSTSGLDIVSDDSYTIVFNDIDGYSGIYYGLAWEGDKVTALETLVTDGKISWVNNAGGFVDIFYDGLSDFSYIAVIPEARTIAFLIAPILLIVLRGLRRR